MTLDSAVELLNRFAGELLKIAFILAASYLGYRIARGAINRSARLIRRGPTLSFDQFSQRTHTLTGVLTSLTKFAFFIIAALMVLREVGVDPTPLLAGAGIAGLAIGFGAQSLVRDIVSGFFILFENQYSIGDTIKVGEHLGKVEAMNLRYTELVDTDGGIHILPNGEIRTLVNLSREWVRVVVDVAVPYEADLEGILIILREECSALAEDSSLRQYLLEKPEVLGIENFSSSGVVIRISARTQPTKQAEVTRELRRRIRNRLAEEGVEIKPTG